jgi:hypothetical protein
MIMMKIIEARQGKRKNDKRCKRFQRRGKGFQRRKRYAIYGTKKTERQESG